MEYLMQLSKNSVETLMREIASLPMLTAHTFKISGSLEFIVFSSGSTNSANFPLLQKSDFIITSVN